MEEDFGGGGERRRGWKEYMSEREGGGKGKAFRYFLLFTLTTAA
jgi:hypothetical protein